MPGKVALLVFDKCQPGSCDGGVCAAAAACPHKLIKQEAPRETPELDPFLCRGCGTCVLACPNKALMISCM